MGNARPATGAFVVQVQARHLRLSPDVQALHRLGAGQAPSPSLDHRGESYRELGRVVPKTRVSHWCDGDIKREALPCKHEQLEEDSMNITEVHINATSDTLA